MTKNRNPRLINLEGQRFGRWLIGKQAGNRPGGAALWHAVCDCGTLGTPSGGDLRYGKTLSCGCLSSETNGANLRTHGGSKTRLHRIWKAMRSRCNNPALPNYAGYGGRGITICAEWDDFSIFRDWALANGYADNLSIDRKENDLGYEPNNCRWATAEVQSQNRRFVKRAPDGTPWAVIAKLNGIKVTLMHGRLHEGWPIEKAATLPIGSRLREFL